MIRVLALLFFASLTLFAAGDATFEGKRELNVAAVAMFMVFILGRILPTKLSQLLQLLGWLIINLLQFTRWLMV